MRCGEDAPGDRDVEYLIEGDRDELLARAGAGDSSLEIASLRAENDRLRAENADLRAKLAEANTEIDSFAARSVR